MEPPESRLSQELQYTDFPLPEITLYLRQGDPALVGIQTLLFFITPPKRSGG
jgi:hypothetical protein